MSLREKAATYEKPTGTRPALDVLIDGLNATRRADLLDLLKGEPLLPHSLVARTINGVYGEKLSRPTTDGQVAAWRNRNGVA